MRGVPEWLKSLRLHKYLPSSCYSSLKAPAPRYTHIVMTLSYREMLALTEQQLEKMGVTKVKKHISKSRSEQTQQINSTPATKVLQSNEGT